MGRGGAESGSGGGTGLDGRGGRGGLEEGGTGSAGSEGIGGRSGAGSAAVSDMKELVLFSDIAAVKSDVSLDSVTGADDLAVFSSSDVVKSMASPSALPTEDLSSSINNGINSRC